MTKPFYRKIGGLHFLALGRCRVSFCRTRPSLSPNGSTQHENIKQPIAVTILAAAVCFSAAFLPAIADQSKPLDYATIQPVEQCFNETLLAPTAELQACLDRFGSAYPVARLGEVHCETDAECVEASILDLRSWERGE